MINLGRFSVSLAVKDLAVSRAFYEALGFAAEELAAPGYGVKWLIMRSGTALVGLFHGMFDRNTLTFNPTDVCALQESLKTRGVHFQVEAKGPGPTFALTTDPDGNPVLLDQH